MKKLPAFLLFMLLFVFGSWRSIYTPQELNYKMHAMLIGIIGQTPLKEELEQIIKSKNINNKKVEIKQLKENAEELQNCQIIFIPESQSKAILNVLALTKKNAVLLITEKGGMIQKGASINFFVLNEKLRFEISKTNLSGHNLKVSNELLKLASDVQ
jgi:hypothetical protein